MKRVIYSLLLSNSILLPAMEKQEQPKVIVTLNKIYNKTDKNIGLYVTNIMQESAPYTVIPAGKTSTVEYSFVAPTRNELKIAYFQISDEPNKKLKLKFAVHANEFKAQLLPYFFKKSESEETWDTHGGPEETLTIDPNEETQILVDII